MEKASGGIFARTTREAAEDDGDEEDWDTTLNTFDANLLPKTTAAISCRENRYSDSLWQTVSLQRGILND